MGTSSTPRDLHAKAGRTFSHTPSRARPRTPAHRYNKQLKLAGLGPDSPNEELFTVFLNSLVTGAASACVTTPPTHPPSLGEDFLLQLPLVISGVGDFKIPLPLKRVCDVPWPATDLTLALVQASSRTSAKPHPGSQQPPAAAAAAAAGGAAGAAAGAGGAGSAASGPTPRPHTKLNAGGEINANAGKRARPK